MAQQDYAMGELTFYEQVEKTIGDVFASIGRCVSRHPWKFLLVTIFINLALGVGWINLDFISDAETLYLPSGSQAWKDEEQVRKIFPDLSRSNFQKLQLNSFGKWASVIIRSKAGNILEGNTLEEISDLNDVIKNITARKDQDTDIHLSDICAMTNGECNADGSLFWSPEFLGAVKQRNIPFPWFMTSKGVSNYKTFIGGRVDRNGTHLHGMEYVKIEYNIRTDGYSEEDIKTWNDAFLRTLKIYTSENIEVLYAHSESLDEEFHDNVFGDLSLFVVTAAAMVVYSVLATVSSRLTDSVGQRMMLGAAGWLATGLAIISSVGFCSAIGVKFASIVGVSPFLVSGIGIDDMFILMSGLTGAQTQPTISDKLAETMRVSGVGITITTLTDLLAFGCGATTSFLGVKNFCIYTGVAVLFCYINNITIFGACIALNERRMEGNKHWLTCRPIKTKEKAKLDGHSKAYMFCCTGKPPTSRSEAESLFDRFPRWLLPKIVLYTPFKIIICFIFMGYLVLAIYGCVNMKQGLRFSQLPNDGSYFKDYAVTKEEFFQRQTPVSFVIKSHYNYSSPGIQNNIEAFMAKVKGHKSFEDDFEINWLNAYKDTPFHNNTSEETFIYGLESFLNHPYGVHFRNDVVFDKSKTKIISSRMYVRSEYLAGSQEEGDLMLLARDLTKDFKCDSFAFYPSFIQFEQYVLVLKQTITNVGIALATVLVVTFIFMPHPVLILFCVVAVAMIMTGVIGFMLFVDKALNAITMSQIIVGIGFSVDFTAHICHGYMCSTGDTRDERVIGAIHKTGSPITHGAISSLLGVAVLAGAKSYAFRTFATVITFVLAFGWAHALLLLPIVLSWIGPGRTQSNLLPRSPIRNGSNSIVGQRLASDNDNIPETLTLQMVQPCNKEDNPDHVDESTKLTVQRDDQTAECRLERNPDARQWKEDVVKNGV